MYDYGARYYLPKTKIFKFYSIPSINQYTVNTKLNFKGSAILFFINQAALSNDYTDGNMTESEYKNNTFMNVYGSLYPMAVTISETFSEWWDNSPMVAEFFNEMQMEFDNWENSIQE